MESSYRSPLQPSQLDDEPRRYKDAPTFQDRAGYVWEWCPTHPSCHRGVVSQHRLVMECQIGRFLSKEERVHHRNHDRADNRPENLELYESQRHHTLAHWADRGRRDPKLLARVKAACDDVSIPFGSLGVAASTLQTICKEQGWKWAPRRRGAKPADLPESRVKEALQGRTTAEAAALLGIHPQTLYLRFDHLLKKRTSPGSLEPHRAEILELANLHRMTYAQIALRFGVSEPTVKKNVARWCKQAGLELRAPLRPWESSQTASKLDARPDVAARRQRRARRRALQLARMEQDKGEPSQELVAAPLM